MPLKSSTPSNFKSTPPPPERTDVERNAQWEELLKRLRASYWQDATFVHRIATEKAASFEGLREYEAIDRIQLCVAELSLHLEQQYLRNKVSSFRVKRTGPEVRAWFDNDALDLSKLIRSTTMAAGRLSPEDSKIVSDVIIDQLFDDEIGLPGFDREVLDGNTLVFTLLPDDAEKRLRYRHDQSSNKQ